MTYLRYFKFVLLLACTVKPLQSKKQCPRQLYYTRKFRNRVVCLMKQTRAAKSTILNFPSTRCSMDPLYSCTGDSFHEFLMPVFHIHLLGNLFSWKIKNEWPSEMRGESWHKLKEWNVARKQTPVKGMICHFNGNQNQGDPLCVILVSTKLNRGYNVMREDRGQKRNIHSLCRCLFFKLTNILLYEKHDLTWEELQQAAGTEPALA